MSVKVMCEMKYDAMIFDLYGTLVDNFEGAAYRRVVHMQADIFGIDRQAFWNAWTNEAIRARRFAGTYASFEENLQDVCRLIGGRYDRARLSMAHEVRMQCTRENLLPRDGVIETLRLLRATGRKIGLISDCAWETPEVFAGTEMAPLMDAAVFSCIEKLKKPDERLYRLAVERLGVAANRCLYVADGNSNELAGAQAAGMDAVLMCAEHEEHIVMARPEPRSWTGPRIAAIPEVLRLASPAAANDRSWRSDAVSARQVV